MDVRPAALTVVLQTGDVRAEVGRKLAPAPGALTLVADLVVEDVGLDLHPFLNVGMLQLHEASTDGGNVALLVGEGNSAGALRVLQLGVSVDAGVADAPVQSIHDHGKLHCLQWSRHAPNENGLPWIQWHGSI